MPAHSMETRHGLTRNAHRRAAFSLPALLVLGILVMLMLVAIPEGAGAAGSSRITGKVVDAATHKPVAGVSVTALRKYAPDPDWPNDFFFKAAAHATTARNGEYTIRRLPAGTYCVEFRPANLKRHASSTVGRSSSAQARQGAASAPSSTPAAGSRGP
jgi:hypothetical protein